MLSWYYVFSLQRTGIYPTSYDKLQLFESKCRDIVISYYLEVQLIISYFINCTCFDQKEITIIYRIQTVSLIYENFQYLMLNWCASLLFFNYIVQCKHSQRTHIHPYEHRHAHMSFKIWHFICKFFRFRCFSLCFSQFLYPLFIFRPPEWRDKIFLDLLPFSLDRFCGL